MTTTPRRPYSIWLEKKFLLWQIDHGRKSVAKFSEFLGFPKTTVIQWLNDQRFPREEHADQIACKLGFDVSGHPLLGFAEPDRDLLKLKYYWPQISERQRATARKLIDEIEQRAAAEEQKRRTE